MLRRSVSAAAGRWPRRALRCVHSGAAEDEDKYLELRQLRDIKRCARLALF